MDEESKNEFRDIRNQLQTLETKLDRILTMLAYSQPHEVAMLERELIGHPERDTEL